MLDPILKKAVSQGGVARRDQLLELGMTPRQIEHRLKSGTFTPVVDGVYRIVAMNEWRDRTAAAVAGLPNAVASHETAARLLSFPGKPAREIVVSVHTRTTHVWPGATVRRCSDLGPSDIASVDGIPSTTPLRTLFDRAAQLSEGAFFDLADTLASTGVISVDRLERLAHRLCRKGKAGSALVRSYLAERSSGPAASPLETRALTLLRNAGLSPEVEYPVPWNPTERFDLAFPAERVAIELDSVQWHATPDQFQADRRRDREAALHDWQNLRFTWRDVEEEPGEMATTVIRIIAQRT